VKTYENIGDTNLTTGIYYYIKEKSGKYLRWDGNYDDYYTKGLYFDLELKDDYRKEWYLFNLEVSQNNKIFIRNAKSSFLLFERQQHIENLVRNNFIYLYNSIYNGTIGGFEFKLMKTKNENWFNIKADGNNEWFPNGYLTSNSQFRVKELIQTLISQISMQLIQLSTRVKVQKSCLLRLKINQLVLMIIY